MKSILHLKKILCAVLFLSALNTYAQNPWVQKANYGGGARAYTVEFTIGHYAFVGLGNNGNYLFDFWKWNQTTNTWSGIPNYPGAGTYCSTAFSIEGKGYVGLGWTGSGGATDLWRYDTITNAWSRMATFPGVGRYDCEAFVIGHKAYLVGGSIAGPPYLQDVWVYDAHQNTWTQLNTFPGGQVEEYISFAIGNHGYVGDGWFPGCNQEMYEYDTTSDTWGTIPNIPVTYGITEQPDCWVSGSKAYLCTGGFCNAAGLKDGWMYDTVTKSWCGFSSISTDKVARGNGVAFTINNKGYFCTGQDTILNYLGDLWEYDPSTKINVADTMNACNHDSVHFSETSSYLAASWSWTFPGGSPATSNLQNPVVYYSTSGTYTAQLILTACGGGDSVSRTITVTAGTLGGIILKGKSPICLGTSDTLTAIGGTSYLWSNGATTSSIIITPASTITYSITISNGTCHKDTTIKIIVDPYPSVVLSGDDTICSGNSTTLSASGGANYLWSNGATTSSISPLPASSITYTVKVSNGPCFIDTSVSVLVNPSPTLVIGHTDTICTGDSVVLTVSGANHYTWTPSTGLSCVNCPNPTATPTVSTTYTVTGYGADGCTTNQSVSVIVSTAPALGTIPNQTTCSGDQVTLVANKLSGFYGTYLWEPGSSTAGSITVTPTTTTTYTVEYTNACGTNSTTVTVFVNPAPIPLFSADVTAGCAPLCVQFRDLSNISSMDNIVMWNWTFGNGVRVSEQNPIYCYPDTGTFTTSLTAVSSNGCSATLQIDGMITVYSKPIANFIYSPEPISILEPTVQFTDKSTDAYGIVFWTWTFGDEEVPNGQNSLRNPIHTYQDTGMYCPQLVVENNKGCVDTNTQCLEVEPLFTLYIPSAFSPNSDGLNESFTAKGTYIKSFEMYIFDRWGMELYYTNDITKGWPGTVKGGTTISQEDSFVYKITATDWSNTQHNYIGEVTLIK